MKLQFAIPIFALIFLISQSLSAKDTISPAILVDDMVITQYQIDQRYLFFKLLNFPGNHFKIAEKSLIDDRLKLKAAEKLGVQVTPEALQYEMKLFAARANLTINQFAERLKKAGIEKTTWENYMQTPILWLETVNRKFASSISSSMLNDNIQNELTNVSNVQVLLTEIIIPVQTGFEDETIQKVENLRQIKSLKKFSEAASLYSVAPTRDVGGKVKWQDLLSLPSIVKPLIAGLSKGEVSEPLLIPGGIAIFQLRDIRESGDNQLNSKFVNYIEFKFKQNSNINEALASNIIICDDLYTFSNNIQESELIRKSSKENSLPENLKAILSELDENEFTIQDNNTDITNLIMVCGRSQQENLSKSDMSKIKRSIANKRLLSLANSYIENLRQEARIVFK